MKPFNPYFIFACHPPEDADVGDPNVDVLVEPAFQDLEQFVDSTNDGKINGALLAVITNSLEGKKREPLYKVSQH